MNGDATASFRDFAAILGCRPSYVTQLRKEGRLVLTDDGKRVQVAASRALIIATRDPAHAGVADRHAATRRAARIADALDATAAADMQDATDASDEPAADGALVSDARRRAKALADKAEADAAAAIRENMLADGLLYRAEDVDHAIAAAVATLRAQLERVPVLVAPQVVAVSDEVTVRDIIATEIERAQRELERQFAAAKGSA